ncbi:MAG TPA: DHH family phosphoesterase [Candidatus Saccharimonadales bacterium]|nr:DHH family phosphoesterase [Candidatus Saccharimonadales bacterium]
MDEQVEKLKSLLNSAQRILITSHISPDPDAVSSMLLLGTTLKENFPEKEISMALEEEPERLEFLGGYPKIAFQPLYNCLENLQPDLLILVDANNYKRCSRQQSEDIRTIIQSKSIKTAVIDHHEPDDKEETDIYINQKSIATVQDIFEVCFNHLELNKPVGYSETTMVGLYSDSGGFVYDNPRHKATFKIVNELLDAGVSLENVNHRLNNFTDDHLAVLSELFINLSHSDDYNFTFVSDGFTHEWAKSGKDPSAIQSACGHFVDQYLRNIENRYWGFVIRPDPIAGPKHYSVSFRSTGGKMNVAAIAKRVGGGGHKPSAGAKFEASDIEDAIKKVKQAISGAVDED